MRDGYQILKPGLSLEQHYSLAGRLWAMAVELTEIRGTVKGEGDGR
jgi:hypothetical protein